MLCYMFVINYKKYLCTLNKRNELANSCPLRNMSKM